MKKIFCAFFLFFAFQIQSYACTGWAVINDDQSVIIAKNRDAIPTQEFVKKTIITSNANDNSLPKSFIGLYAYGDKQTTLQTKELKAGVNDKGLVMTSLSARTTLGKSEKNLYSKGIMRFILSHYTSVQSIFNELTSTEKSTSLQTQFLIQSSILAKNKKGIPILKSHAMFYMFADNKNIAYLEIAPDGTFAIVSNLNSDAKILTHANQYQTLKFSTLTPKTINLNHIAYPSSVDRMNTINSLLNNNKKNPFTMSNFINFANNQANTNRPNNNLCRTRNSESSEITMATFIVSFPSKIEGPLIYIKVNNLIGPATEYKVIVYNKWDSSVAKKISPFCQTIN